MIDEHLQGSVQLLGFRDNPYPYMAAADLYVCPSYVEGFSTVVSEAVVLETPVVTTDCSGMREILGDSEYGLITQNTEESSSRACGRCWTSRKSTNTTSSASASAHRSSIWKKG